MHSVKYGGQSIYYSFTGRHKSIPSHNVVQGKNYLQRILFTLHSNIRNLIYCRILIVVLIVEYDMYIINPPFTGTHKRFRIQYVLFQTSISDNILTVNFVFAFFRFLLEGILVKIMFLWKSYWIKTLSSS